MNGSLPVSSIVFAHISHVHSVATRRTTCLSAAFPQHFLRLSFSAVMSRACERCSRSHTGEYGSGRFCTASCAKQVGAAARKQSVADRARRSAAMVPLPSLPRPLPVPAQLPSNSPSGCSSPPRKKTVRSESPITIAITTTPTTGNVAALRLRCEGCNAPHDGSYASGRFCSVQCARRTAAALKWSKRRASRSQSSTTATTTNTSTPVVASSPVTVVPSMLPPLPTDDFSLGKRSHAVVSHTPLAPMVHPRSIQYGYGHPCVPIPPYAHPHTFVPPFTPTPHSYNVSHSHSTLIGARTTPTPIAKRDVNLHIDDDPNQSTGSMPYPTHLPVQLPIGMPLTSCYSYASPPPVSFGAPYVPVQYGPIRVAPAPQSFSNNISRCAEIRSSTSIKPRSPKLEKSKVKKIVTTREQRSNGMKVIEKDEEGPPPPLSTIDIDEKCTDQDTAATAAAEMLLSLRNK